MRDISNHTDVFQDPGFTGVFCKSSYIQVKAQRAHRKFQLTEVHG